VTSAEKKIDAMRANPKGDWQIDDFESVAKGARDVGSQGRREPCGFLAREEPNESHGPGQAADQGGLCA
jgi:hypothetical protein